MVFANSKIPRSVAAASIWWWLILAVLSISLCSGDEIHEHLKRLNKPPLKSIKSADGDIIDCVHVSQQPAFDHPSLENHMIQMWPSNYPEGFDADQNVSIKQTWHLNGNCPEETIPIIRTKREDILRAGSLKNFGKKHIGSNTTTHDLVGDNVAHEYATAYTRGRYFGTKATINLWNPYIEQPNEFSLSQVWVVEDSILSEQNTIEAGWQVYPQIYGDYSPRLFVFWTSDNYKNGCYNLQCPGFVQTSSKIAVGATVLSPVSSYNGAQYVINLLIWKDSSTGHWWLMYGDEMVGYWPSNLFSHLQNGATQVTWGGEIVNLAFTSYHTKTQMGSGYFPNQGYGKASFFNNIQIVDGFNNLRTPQDTFPYAPKPNCYDINIVSSGTNWGTYFYYGGPGGNYLGCTT